MKQLQLGQWLIEYDDIATASSYQTMHFVNEGCKCITCENYFHGVDHFPPEVQSILNKMDIDARKPSEAYDCGIFENGRLLYGGVYHIVGNYLLGADAWQPVKKKRLFRKSVHSNQTSLYMLTDGYEIGFTNMVVLVPPDFQRPVLQMEISFRVPWVLKDDYPTL